MKKISLVQLKANQKGKIIEIHAGSGLQNRLLSMGISPGREITKLSQFMLRGPVAIKVGRSIIALGYGMAHKIIVEVE
ncbi:MAG: ferrous iron transport protein A [Candidatus Omnitrophica bacterium]|nr:ferrous iron transport protein A [Candidatus Omnitrophota bacterium]